MLICILIYVMLIHKVFSSFATEFTDGCRRDFSIVVDDYIVFFPFCFLCVNSLASFIIDECLIYESADILSPFWATFEAMSFPCLSSP